jgi:NAD(P)H-flavin reductase
MFAAYWWYWKDASLKDIYQIPQKLPTSTDNFTVPIIQWVVWISIISIGFMSLYAPFRRKNFNIFMMLHHFTYLTLIPAILWHAAAAWEYILPSVTIWFFDRIVRAYRSVKRVNLVNASQALQSEPAANPFNPNSIDISVVTPDPISSIHDYSLTFPRIQSLPTVESSLPRAESAINSSPSFSNSTDRHNYHKQRALNVSGPGVKIVDRGEAGQYIELRIVNDHMVYFPGHYAFLNIAEISLFEWHPFTIASPAHYNARPEIVFVIKTMGPNTWTQSLYNYVEEFYRDNGYPGTDYVDVPLTVSLDGPYGTPIDFSTYDIVILLGGGIGITPCKSIYESLLLSYLHDFKARLMYQHTQKTLLEQQNNYNFNANNDSQNNAHNTPLINTTSNLSEPNTNPLLNNLNIVTVPLVETNKRVHLMWSARDPMLFELMSESLSQAPYGPFSAQLYCDHPLRSVQSDADLIKEEISILDKNILSLIRPGRPNLELEFSNIVGGLNPNSYLSGSHDGNSTIAPSASLSEAGRPSGPVDPTSSLHGGFTDESKKKVLVFVCGPEAMAKDAEIICQKKGWDFHTETFAL